MTPVYREELTLQAGLLTASGIISYALHRYLGKTSWRGVMRDALIVLLPIEGVRIALLLRELQQRPTEAKMQKLHDEIAELQKRPSPEDLQKLQESIEWQRKPPPGLICLRLSAYVDLQKGVPDLRDRRIASVCLRSWKEGVNLTQLIGKIPCFETRVFIPSFPLDLCRSLAELRLGTQTINNFPDLMKAVQGSQTLRVFQLKRQGVPNQQDIEALVEMLKSNQKLRLCSIGIGNQEGNSEGFINMSSPLKASKITECAIFAQTQRGYFRIAHKKGERIKALQVKICMQIPESMLTKTVKRVGRALDRGAALIVDAFSAR